MQMTLNIQSILFNTKHVYQFLNKGMILYYVKIENPWVPVPSNCVSDWSMTQYINLHIQLQYSFENISSLSFQG